MLLLILDGLPLYLRLGHVVCPDGHLGSVLYSTQPHPGQCNIHHILHQAHEVLGERLQVSTFFLRQFPSLPFLPSQTHFHWTHQQPKVWRDVRVQILIWFQTFLLFTKPHFQTFDNQQFKCNENHIFSGISDYFRRREWFMVHHVVDLKRSVCIVFLD